MKSDTEIEVKALTPFGPTMLHTNVPLYVIDNYNKYCDKIITDKDLSKTYDYSSQLAGNVKQEFLIDGGFIESEKNLNNIIMLMAKRMISPGLRGNEGNLSFSYLKNAPKRSINIKVTEITGTELISMWCVSQYAGDFNPLHVHSGDLSGVVYLKVPPCIAEERAKEDHHPAVGDIQFIAGTPQSFSSNNIQFIPKVGDLYIFPSWLHHTVYPFRTQDQERRSISFNLNYKINIKEVENKNYHEKMIQREKKNKEKEKDGSLGPTG